MDLRSILVLVQGSTAGTVVRAACTLAQRHDASLVGLHVIEPWPIAMADGADLSGRIYEMQREQLGAEAAQAQQIFQSVTNETSVETEWRCEEGATQAIVDSHARHCDLLCVGAEDPGYAGSSIVGDLLFSVGRPVLVIPASYCAGAIGENVAVAWDASRESARAVTDAMGILKKAGTVAVVIVADGSTSDRKSGVSEVAVSRYLAQHEVQAQSYTVRPGDTPEGEALHGWVREHGQDLLVMGAYGHSRIREMALGGVTRWMLRHAEIPLLMSH